MVAILLQHNAFRMIALYCLVIGVAYAHQSLCRSSPVLTGAFITTRNRHATAPMAPTNSGGSRR